MTEQMAGSESMNQQMKSEVENILKGLSTEERDAIILGGASSLRNTVRNKLTEYGFF